MVFVLNFNSPKKMVATEKINIWRKETREWVNNRFRQNAQTTLLWKTKWTGLITTETRSNFYVKKRIIDNFSISRFRFPNFDLCGIRYSDNSE